MAIALAGALAATPADAQEKDIAAYIALSMTPAGALPLTARTTMFDSAPSPATYTARYGTQEDLRHVGLGLEMPVAGSVRLGVTLGYSTVADCGPCEESVMFGIDVIAPLARRTIGSGSSPYALSVSLNPILGVARPGDGNLTMFAASVGLPIAITTGDAGTRLALFVSPGMGLGSIVFDDESFTGVRPMLGGGVGVRAGLITVTASAQRVFIDDGDIEFGLALSLQDR
jgi:hypothetical protein